MAPSTVSPAPLAAAALAAPFATVMLRSSTSSVVLLIVVVVPLTVKLPVMIALPPIVVLAAVIVCAVTPPAVNVIVSVVNPSLVSGSPRCRISDGMNKLVPSNWKSGWAVNALPPPDVIILSAPAVVIGLAVALASMPSNLVPSVATSLPSTVPETAILPVILTPVFVVSNFWLPLNWRVTPPAVSKNALVLDWSILLIRMSVPESRNIPVWFSILDSVLLWKTFSNLEY